MTRYAISEPARSKANKAILTSLLLFALPLTVLGAYFTTITIAGIGPLLIGVVWLVFSLLALSSRLLVSIDETGLETSGSKLASANKKLAWDKVSQAKLIGLQNAPVLQLFSPAGVVAIAGNNYEKFDEMTSLVSAQLEKKGLKLVDERKPAPGTPA